MPEPLVAYSRDKDRNIGAPPKTAAKEPSIEMLPSRLIQENSELKVFALDAPDTEVDGMCHNYCVQTQKGDALQMIHFQYGSAEDVGVNGITHHQLLAILEDRLRCFQRGPFSSQINEVTLTCIMSARALGNEIARFHGMLTGEKPSLQKGKIPVVSKDKIDTTGFRLVDKTENLSVFAMDLPDPNAGGACHEYVVVDNDDCRIEIISFQHGGINQKRPDGTPNGINGVQHLELLSMVEDRLRCAQISNFPTPQNEFVLMNVLNAINMDKERTKRRALAGLEGFNKRSKGVEK